MNKLEVTMTDGTVYVTHFENESNVHYYASCVRGSANDLVELPNAISKDYKYVKNRKLSVFVSKRNIVKMELFTKVS